MTILLLTHSYPDENNRWRGMFIKEQAAALGIVHEVIVVYFKTDNSRLAPFSKYSFEKKINGNVIEYSVTTSRSFPVINQIKYLRDTLSFIRNEIIPLHKIDIVHSHLSYPAGFLGLLAGRKLNVPTVLTEHSWVTNYFRSNVHRMCVLRALRGSDSVVTVSNALKENVLLFCRREVTVVPNVVDTDKFFIIDERKAGVTNIGLLGGMGTRIKGVDVLLNAIAMLKEKNVRVHIGGDGKYLGEYKELAATLGIADRCIFYGEITSDKKNDFYSALDVYVMASHRETFGVVVVEAMASGIPVISTRCGGPEEIITSSTGVLIQKDNPADLAKAIEAFCKNPDVFDKKTIRQYAVANFGQAAFNKRMSELYNGILKTD